MKDLVWDKTLSVEVSEIDDDHRRLLELFNRLGHSVEGGESLEAVAATMDELIACTAWHFQHEERLMQKHGFPGFESHRAEHQELIASGKAMQQRLREQSATLSPRDIEGLEQWLTGHIYGLDMAMGSYLAEAM